jgi:signal transduction histidine kinase
VSDRGSVIRRDQRLYLIVAERVRFVDEHLATLVAAWALDDGRASEFSAVTQTHVTFFAGSTVSGRSFPAASLDRPASPADGASPEPGPAVAPATPPRFAELEVDLVGDGGSGRLVLQIDRTPTEALLARLTSRLTWVAAITLGLGMVVLVVSNRRVSMHMSTITRAAMDIAGGDWHQRVPARGSSEAVVLAEAFNEMTASLVHWHAEAEARMDRLTAAHRYLETARDAAEAASVAKSAFLANMSHELRTPLNAIIGYTELIEEEATARGQQEMLPDLQRVLVASRHLLALITDVLDLSKIEAGRMELELASHDVDALVRGVVAAAAPLASARGNTLEVNTPRLIGMISIDHTRVRQILLNLVGNACKFTENGVVTVRAVRETTADGDSVVVTVRDTGIGMSPGQVARLFQEFSQADASTTRRYGGSGLGLAISRRLGNLMGGVIEVESQLGEGSTFTFRLPVSTATGAPQTYGDTAAMPPDACHRRPVSARPRSAARSCRCGDCSPSGDAPRPPRQVAARCG